MGQRFCGRGACHTPYVWILRVVHRGACSVGSTPQCVGLAHESRPSLHNANDRCLGCVAYPAAAIRSVATRPIFQGNEDESCMLDFWKFWLAGPWSSRHGFLKAQSDDYLGSCIPIMWHLDGVEFHRNQEVLVYSWSSVLAAGGDIWHTKFPLLILPYRYINDKAIIFLTCSEDPTISLGRSFLFQVRVERFSESHFALLCKGSTKRSNSEALAGRAKGARPKCGPILPSAPCTTRRELVSIGIRLFGRRRWLTSPSTLRYALEVPA